MNKVLSFLLFASIFSSPIYAQNKGINLFNNSFLHQIKFDSPTIINGELWDSLTDSYTMVNMTIDGEVVDSVGIRHKGFTSRASSQKPLKIDINKYVSGKKYDGLKKFNLHNNFKDDFLQRENLAYEVYRRAGLPSPRTSYAEVFVDDNFVGLYSVVEQIDKTFLGHNFPSDNGSLIKAEPPGFVPGIMLEVKEGTMDEFNEFKNNASISNLNGYINLRNFMKQLAVDVILEDWDSYSFNRHNFYIYYERKSGLLNLINYDHNYAFAVDDPNQYLYPIGTFPFSTSLIEDSGMKIMYEQTLCELLTYLLDPDFISNETSNNYSIINSNSHGIKASDPVTLNQYITNRKTWLQDTLSSLNVNCSNLSFPLYANDLVINEFVASSDSLEGVQEPNGGTPDWIELYNNSSNDIILNEKYYLSDDRNFPKKWHFPEEVNIPANNYIIVWADKDVHQQGIHAGFKLEKDGGNVLLTYENLEEVQNISYSQQITNKGYARVPNGTGEFVIQQHTFNSNNNEIVGIDDIKELELVLYPNPANDFIWIYSTRSIDLLVFYNIYGKQLRQIKNPVFPLTINDLTSGMYFVEIVSARKKYNLKLIVK